MFKFMKLLKIFNAIFAVLSFGAMSVGYNLAERYEESHNQPEEIEFVSPHQHSFETQIIYPTCTTQGYTLYTCSVCGYEYKDNYTGLAEHDYEVEEIVQPTCTEQGYTLYTCSVCGDSYIDNYTTKLEHNYGEWILTTEPTCTKTGVETRYCSHDNTHTETRTVNKLGHNYNSVVTPPTCTTQGYTTHTCSRCGDSYVDTYTAKLEHNYVVNDITKDCPLSAEYKYICTECGDTTKQGEKYCGQVNATHNELYEDDICPYCGCTVYKKVGDSVLMINSNNELSAEFYGTEIYDFGSNKKQYITNAYIADSVTNIGDNAFYNCGNLTSVTIGNSVTSIGGKAFRDCYSLTSITIPDSVTSIKYYAFYGCSSFSEITIPDSVTSIGNDAFRWCDSLTSIYYTGTASEWTQIDGLSNLMGYEANNKTLYINSEPVTDVVLENITKIKPYAFAGCRSLTSITIGDSVTSIGNYAFYKCSSLTSVTIPDSVTSIGDCAFCSCNSLTSITFKGTKAQWNAISKGDSWDYGIPLTCKVHCTDGDMNL